MLNASESLIGRIWPYRHGGVKFHTKMNFGLLFLKWSLGTQESSCKVLDQQDNLLID